MHEGQHDIFADIDDLDTIFGKNQPKKEQQNHVPQQAPPIQKSDPQKT